jgi:hypothetical protein
VPERLAPADSLLLRLERSGHPMALVGVTVCEGPAPDLDRVRERVERLLPSVPRFRSRPVDVPLELERPVWAEDGRLDLTEHVRSAAFAIDTDEPIAWLSERLAAQPFEGDRPRWELLLLDGPGPGQWVLAARFHLALVDTLTGPDLYSCVMAPRVTPPPAPALEGRPPPYRLLVDALRDLVSSPYEQVRLLRSAVRRVRPEPPPPAAVPTHQRRLVVPLDALKAVRDELGGSVNDVLATMAAVAVGRATSRSDVRLTIPFAVRSLSRPGQFDNQVEVAEVELPASTAKPTQQYRTVSERLDHVARENLAVGGRFLGRVAAPTPLVLLALGARASMGTDADVVLVNGPGPPTTGPVFTGRSVEAHAAIPHPPGAHFCITALSHAGHVSLAISGPDASELDVVVTELSTSLEALQSRPGSSRTPRT